MVYVTSKIILLLSLTYSRMSRVKLGDAWYVSNVSIIFDAPCFFYTICLVFRYTSCRFYAISGTNLLTRCHSASSLFSVVFVFQKSYTGNILRIARNKFGNSYFFRTKDDDQTGTGEGPEAGHTTRGRGPVPGRAHLWWGHPGGPLTPPLCLFKASVTKTLKQSAFFPEQFHSAAAVEDKFWGTEVSILAPCRDGEVTPEPSPLVSITVSAVSIDLTAIL
jgi:hypothetical protein